MGGLIRVLVGKKKVEGRHGCLLEMMQVPYLDGIVG